MRTSRVFLLCVSGMRMSRVYENISCVSLVNLCMRTSCVFLLCVSGMVTSSVFFCVDNVTCVSLVC